MWSRVLGWCLFVQREPFCDDYSLLDACKRAAVQDKIYLPPPPKITTAHTQHNDLSGIVLLSIQVSDQTEAALLIQTVAHLSKQEQHWSLLREMMKEPQSEQVNNAKLVWCFTSKTTFYTQRIREESHKHRNI